MGDGSDGGKSGGARAAKEAEQYGFGLIGAGVAGSDAVDLTGGNFVVEEGEAGFAGEFLQIAGSGGEVGFAKRKNEPKLGGQLANEFRIGFTFGTAEAVV